jgi:hypothetical protein
MFRIFFVINKFKLTTTWQVACHHFSVTGQIITIDDDQVSGICKVLDRARREPAEELVDWGCASAAYAPVNQSSHVLIKVNVQALRLEYKSGLFNLFRNEARVDRLAVDRFSVEIAANAPSGDISKLIETITPLADTVRSYCFGEVLDAASSGHSVPPARINVSDYDRSLESRNTGSNPLDIWV